jgi:phage repressor protein C with HTH and peptisase S24 domain
MSKKDYTGDGLVFYELVKKSRKTIGQVQKELEISNGTLYNYYESEVLSEDIKKQIRAWAIENIESSIGEIFLPNGEKSKLKRKVPVIGEGAAGDMQIYTNENQDLEYIDVGDLLRDSEAAFTVYGNSMTPNYPSGCILGIKRNYDGFIQPGETYLLVTKSSRLFKRLYYLDDKTGYECVSDNMMIYESGQKKGQYIYPIFPVKFEDVISIYDVTGMIRRNRNSDIIQRQK